MEGGGMDYQSTASPDEEEGGESGKKVGVKHARSLGFSALTALLFFSVAGGPLGTEGLVRFAGPLYSVIGLAIIPFVWSFPVGLVTAELSTAFPKDGGYVLWVDAAFGRFPGFLMGWVSWANGVVDSALYPALFIALLEDSTGMQCPASLRLAAILGINVALTLPNLFGLDVVGSASVAFAGIVLMPVAILVLVCLPNISPGNWLDTPAVIDWVGFLNLVLWNTNGWDACSTCGGEVAEPTTTYPRAMMAAQGLVIVPYMIMILASTGVDPRLEMYHNGWYNALAVQQGGEVLGALFAVGTIAGVMGMFVSNMTCYSYQLSGMAEEGMLPSALAIRLPKFDTPVVSISVCFLCVSLLSQFSFREILVADNLLYSLCLLLELAAMVKLRVSRPNMTRPFRIPTSTAGVVCLVACPSALCLFIMYSAGAQVWGLAVCVVLAGCGVFFINERLVPAYRAV